MASTISSNVRSLRPPIVTPKPSMWADTFATFSFDHQLQEKYAKEIEELKKEAQSVLMAATSTKLMILIDELEQLGLSYHFESAIEEKLKQVYDSSDKDQDLFTTSLRFRLLRQHQYHVSCDVFDKFTDKDNKWELEESINSDVEGILSLFEAAHVRIRDEKILDEAVEVTVHHLRRMLPALDNSCIKEKVEQALKYPIHKGLPLLNFRFNISIYERQGLKSELILKLAKLNFNFLQNIYRQELAVLTSWWNKFDLKSKLPYARDRLVECYLWGAALGYGPQYSYLRATTAKTMQMISIMDDTYDNYATLEEDDLFTEILDRWNLDDIDRLPDFMKVVYRFIVGVCEDYECEAEKQECLFAVPYYKESLKQLSRAYNIEQKWIMERNMPCYEEYMTNSVITSGIYPMFISFVPGMRSVTEEEVRWLLSEPKLVISTAIMGRTLQDLGSHERENREGKLLTVVDCYMEDKGVSKEETINKFEELVEVGWKDVTAEYAEGSRVHKQLLEQLLNYGRLAYLTYNKDGDGYTYPENYMGPLAAALLLDPLLV